MSRSGYWSEGRYVKPKWNRGEGISCSCRYCSTGFVDKNVPRFALMECGELLIFPKFGSISKLKGVAIRGCVFPVVTEEKVPGDTWNRTHLIPSRAVIQAWSPNGSGVSVEMLDRVAKGLTEKLSLPVSPENKMVPPGPGIGDKSSGWRRPLENIEYWWHEDNPWYWLVF